jgi:hypothetical protein
MNSGCYSNRQIVVACAIGSLAAWCMIVIPLTLQQLWHHSFSIVGWHRAGEIILVLGLFGIPLALTLGILVGFPAVTFANRLGRNRYVDALMFGAATGLLIGAVMLAYDLFQGLGDYLDDTVHGSYGDGHGNLMDNGMPTARGWLYWFGYFIQLAIVGALVGATVRWRLGLQFSGNRLSAVQP